MRKTALLVAMTAMLAACGQPTSPTVVHFTTPSADASATPPASATPSTGSTPAASPTAVASTLTGSYGILIAGGRVELVKTDASIAAVAPIAAPSVQYCSSNSDGAMEAPPVSASGHQVYFRDGDTRIRRLTPPTGSTDVTTVPGGSTQVSFFSVSPDDQRIAVVVEDISAATTISLRLYVEDLVGHGHHADIYTTTQPKGKTGTTLWPMGWHGGALVLAVVVHRPLPPASSSSGPGPTRPSRGTWPAAGSTRTISSPPTASSSFPPKHLETSTSTRRSKRSRPPATALAGSRAASDSTSGPWVYSPSQSISPTNSAASP